MLSSPAARRKHCYLRVIMLHTTEKNIQVGLLFHMTIDLEVSRGGFPGKCPKCSLLALRRQPFTDPLPIGSLFAINRSWHYKLHGDVLKFMWVALRANWLKPCTDRYLPIKVAFCEKTASVGLHPQPLHHFTPFLLQWYSTVTKTP